MTTTRGWKPENGGNAVEELLGSSLFIGWLVIAALYIAAVVTIRCAARSWIKKLHGRRNP